MGQPYKKMPVFHSQTFAEKEQLAFHAFVHGKTLQYWSSDKRVWTDDRSPDVQRWRGLEYRIKPEGVDEP